jgi:hypothetical protein
MRNIKPDRDDIKKGAVLFCVPPHRTEGNKEVTITKVARLYFYTSDNRQWSLSTLKQVTNYLGATLYKSRSAYEEYQQWQTKWREFKREFKQEIYGSNSQPLLTTEQIDVINEWIIDNKGSVH